jgi:hypothetical protein
MKKIILAAVLVSVMTTVAQAACGWVLWEDYLPQAGNTIGEEWLPVMGFDTFVACSTAAASLQEDLDARVKKAEFDARVKKGGSGGKTAVCFPSDFDPRPRQDHGK